MAKPRLKSAPAPKQLTPLEAATEWAAAYPCVGDCVAILPETHQDLAGGGLLMPDLPGSKSAFSGIVLSCGPQAADTCQAGQRVFHPSVGGNEIAVTHAGVRLRLIILSAKEVLAAGWPR